VSAFGQDIVAVVEQLRVEHVVLIGHSMGGRWIVEAARRLPTAVIGVVSLDTWANVEQVQTPAQVAARLEPFRTQFVEAVRTFVRGMFVPMSDPTLVEHVAAAMSAAPPPIALGVAQESWGSDPLLQEGLQEVKIPKIALNSAWRATNLEAAQRYGIEVVQMANVGHFMMLEDPQTFNCLLDEAVQKCIHARARQ
jgi:pimeloyl-ACP methyl ester carboxylesterase